MGVYSTDGSDFRPIAATGNQFIDGILNAFAWNHTTLTVSFPTHLPQYAGVRPGSGDGLTGFVAMNAQQQAAAQAVLAEVALYTNLQFDFMTETPDEHALIRYAGGLNSDTAEAGIPNYPTISVDASGDVWFADNGQYDDPVKGTFAWMQFHHETGHALGLTHSHDPDIYGTIPPGNDFLTYTVMSYRSYARQPLEDILYSNERDGYPQTYMLRDIAALQTIYGANYTSNAGDTVYKWDPDTGEQFVDDEGQGAPSANRIFQTLWDGGGNDTYDFSNYNTGVTVDLRPGHWSTLSGFQLAYTGTDRHGTDLYAPGNVANALLHGGDKRSLIENATGGDGHDTIVGNGAANHLVGGIGADELYGLGGRDRLEGGIGPDTLDGGAGNDVLAGNQGDDTLLGGDGIDTADYSAAGAAVTVDLSNTGAQDTGAGTGSDTLDGIENLTGSNFNDTLTGDGSANRIDGGTGADTISGGGGDDVLIGGGGNDVFLFGEDFGRFDRIDGGAGGDTVVLDGDYARLVALGPKSLVDIETVELTAGNDYTLKTADANVAAGDTLTIDGSALFAGDTLTFSGLAETDGRFVLIGGGGADTLRAGGGNDLIIGGGGRDVLIGDAGADIFRYSDISETTIGAYDIIRDFVAGVDRIDLSAIDAAAGGGDDAFNFVGNGNLENAGDMQALFSGGNTIISGDVTGDLLADFQITLIGLHNLTSTDFML